MPERSRKDLNTTAFNIVQQITSDKPTEDSGKNPAAVALGRLGGKKGGPARAKNLTAKQRSEIAKKAAKARWKNHE